MFPSSNRQKAKKNLSESKADPKGQEKERKVMAKIYRPQKGQFYVVSGVVKAVSEDKMKITVASEVYNKAEKKAEPEEITFTCRTPVDEFCKENALVTVVAFDNVDPMTMETASNAAYVSTGNKSFTVQDISVVNGEVVYARYNEEKDENGNPNMTKPRMGADGKEIPAKEKSPHFDIAVTAYDNDGEGNVKKVLHIIKQYPATIKDKNGNVTGKDSSEIEKLKKRFASFDRTENPMRVTIVTRPGQESVGKPREYNGQTYTDNYNNHMGVRSLDIELIKERKLAKAEAQAAYKEGASSGTVEQQAPASAPVEPAKTDVESVVDEVENGNLFDFD